MVKALLHYYSANTIILTEEGLVLGQAGHSKQDTASRGHSKQGRVVVGYRGVARHCMAPSDAAQMAHAFAVLPHLALLTISSVSMTICNKWLSVATGKMHPVSFSSYRGPMGESEN